jgi:hypothetical protein
MPQISRLEKLGCFKGQQLASQNFFKSSQKCTFVKCFYNSPPQQLLFCKGPLPAVPTKLEGTGPVHLRSQKFRSPALSRKQQNIIPTLSPLVLQAGYSAEGMLRRDRLTSCRPGARLRSRRSSLGRRLGSENTSAIHSGSGEAQVVLQPA